MKRIYLTSLAVLASLAVWASGAWRTIPSKAFSYTDSVTITNAGTAPLAITALSCQFTSSASGTILITKHSGNNAFVIKSHTFTSQTNLWFSEVEFVGDSIKQGEYYTISDDTGASITNDIIVNLKGELQ